MDQPRIERTASDWRLNGYADPSALVGFLKSLRTVRFFEQHKPVPENVLQDVLDVARWSGSARNRQPWEFVVVRDRETLESLAACEGRAAHLANAAVGIVLVMAGESEFFEQETFDEGRLSERISLTAASYGVASSLGWFKGTGPGKGQEHPRDTAVQAGEDGALFGLPDLFACGRTPGAAQGAQAPLGAGARSALRTEEDFLRGNGCGWCWKLLAPQRRLAIHQTLAEIGHR